MHGAILVMTRHGGHFPYSAIPSSAFSYSVFRIPRFTNSPGCQIPVIQLRGLHTSVGEALPESILQISP